MVSADRWWCDLNR